MLAPERKSKLKSGALTWIKEMQRGAYYRAPMSRPNASHGARRPVPFASRPAHPRSPLERGATTRADLDNIFKPERYERGARVLDARRYGSRAGVSQREHTTLPSILLKPRLNSVRAVRTTNRINPTRKSACPVWAYLTANPPQRPPAPVH